MPAATALRSRGYVDDLMRLPDQSFITAYWTGSTALNHLAEARDQVMDRVGKSGIQGECGPKLNEEKDARYWHGQPALRGRSLRTKSRRA